MGDQVFALDRNWRFRAVEPGEMADFAGRTLPPKGAFEEWMEARIPGCAHLDLVAAGKLKDPFQNQNERASWWVEKEEFVYKTNFLLPDAWLKGIGREGQRAELQFESLDTFAHIYLNGEYVGESTNQFLPCTIDVTTKLRPGENVLHVHFESSVKRCVSREIEFGRLEADFDRTRVYARRPQSATGWNMAPRLSGCGIVGNVLMRLVNQVKLRNVNVPLTMLSGNQARFNVETDMEGLAERTIDLQIIVERLDPVGSGTNYRATVVGDTSKRIAIKAGTFRFAEGFKIEEPVLWWPLGHGQGRRTLYRARVVARLDGNVLDELETVFGLRKVELVNEPGNGEFNLQINGHPVFVRGAIWVPPDVFAPRVTEEETRRLLDLAAAANINLLRVWGGGSYESEAFYRRCDELGIMVWQDFMYARGEYPDFPAYWSSIQREASHHIKRLRNHASLVLWCGNDGKEWYDHKRTAAWDRSKGGKIFSRLLSQLVADNDPSRPYWRSTPFGGDDPNSAKEGDHHATTWDNWEPAEAFRTIRSPFVSSFGFQSLPSEECIATFTGNRDHTLNHPDYESHQKQTEGNARLFRHIISRVRPPESFEEMVYLSQWVQAQAVTTGIDWWRSMKPNTWGACVWHFNDCWPGISWSLVDHTKKPKLAYWAVRQAFAPVSLILVNTEDGFRAVVVHDGPRTDGDQRLTLRLKSYALDGRVIDWVESPVELPAGGKAEVGLFSLASLGIRDARDAVVVGELYSGRTVLSSRLYSPVEPKHAGYREPELSVVLDCILGSQRAVLLVRSQNVVRGVEFDFRSMDGARLRFENGFDIWPSREVWLQVDLPFLATREELVNGLRFRCLNDAVPGRRIHWRNVTVAIAESSSTAEIPIDGAGMTSRLRMSDVIQKPKF